MIESSEECELLELLKTGSETAFCALYEAHKYRVQFAAFYTLRNEQEAEDVLQEVFKELWKNKEKLKINISIGHYLVRAARNKSLNILRSKEVHDKYVTYRSQQESAELPNHKMENADILKNINTALGSISSSIMRDAFTMVHIDGLNYEQTARKLGITVPTSRTYVYKAIKQLRGILKKTLLFFVYVLMLYVS
jgi:RNA polymerase sigma-70 factor (ECF subfamily)